MDMSERIKEALHLQRWTQADLSRETGFHKVTINKWVKNKAKPGPNAIKAICLALDISESWLYTGLNPVKPLKISRDVVETKGDRIKRHIQNHDWPPEVVACCFTAIKSAGFNPDEPYEGPE